MADVNVSIALAGITAIEKQLASLRGEFDGLGKTGVTTSAKLGQLASSIGSVGTKLSLAAVPVAAFGASLLKTAGNYEAAMNKLEVSTGATTEQMQQVAAAAKNFGETTTFSTTEAVAGFQELATTGVTLEEAMGGVMQATVDFAAATGTELAPAAQFAGDTMAQFNIEARDMPEALNEVYNATLQSKFGVADFGQALSNSGAAAASLHVPFDQLNALLATTSSGFKSGMETGTSMSYFLQNLTPQTKNAADEMKRLGLITADGANQFYTAEGTLKGLDEVQRIAIGTFGKLTDQQKLQSAATIFGQQGMDTLNMIMLQGVDAYEKNLTAINKHNTASAAAKKAMEGFNGAIDQLWGAIDNLAIALETSGFLDFMADMILYLTDAINWVSKLDPMIINFGAALGTAAVLGGPLLLLISGLLSPMGLLLAPILAMTTGIAALAAGFIRFSDAIGTAFHRSVANAYDVLRSLGSVIGVEIPERMLKLGATFADVPENVTQSMAYTAKAVEDGGKKIGPTIDKSLTKPIGNAADTFEVQSNKISAKYKEMAEAIADDEGLGLDEKMAGLAKLGIALTNMGEVGKEAANELREAIKKVAAETASAQLEKIIDDVTLSYGAQLEAVEALIPEYDKLGKFGVEGLAKIKDEAAKLQSEMATHIKDANWGLDDKMLAFEGLQESMEITGNTGVQAMEALNQTIKDTVTAAADEKLKLITDDLSLSLEEQIVKVGESRDTWKDFGEKASEANKLATETYSDLNKEVASSNIDRLLDDTSLSMQKQIEELEGMARGYDNMGESGKEAAKEARDALAKLRLEQERSNDVIYGVNTALESNIRAWGGWGDSAGRIVAGFSAASEAALSELFMTGEFHIEEFGLALKQTLADEAAKTVMSFVSQGIKAFIEWGVTMFTSMVTGAGGMDIAAVSALFLDAALAPILIVVLAIAAAIGIFLLLGGDMGDLMSWLGNIAKTLGGFLIDMILVPVNLLIAGFSALVDLLAVFVKWIGTIGDALGKGDLKDLFSIFEGFNPLKGIGDFFGGLFGGLFHEGGLIPGKGDIAIRAEGGEFVMSKAATEMFGPLLKAMNDRGLGKSMNVAVVHAGDVAKADPFKAFASGGDMMLTRPTLLLGGESGPEMVSFRHGRSGNDAPIINNGILVADRLTLNQLGKKLYRNAQRDQLRTRKR